MQVAVGTRTKLLWAGGNTGGKCWPDQIKNTQGVSPRAESGSSLQNPACLCPVVPPAPLLRAVELSSSQPSSPNWVP